MSQPNYKRAKVILCLIFIAAMFAVPLLLLHTPLKDRIMSGKHLYVIGVFEVILAFVFCLSFYQIKSMQFPDKTSYEIRRAFSKPIPTFIVMPLLATIVFLFLYPYNKTMAGIAVIVIVFASQVYLKFKKKRK